jgi:hypothetical protein
MTNGTKPYTLNAEYDFDERLLEEFSKESSIPLVRPFGVFHLAIKLKENQEPCVHGIGYPALICRYILKDYITEDYDAYLQSIFAKMKHYGNYVNIQFHSQTKKTMSITLADNYSSIKDITAISFDYAIHLRDKKHLYPTAEVTIVFEGESAYEFSIEENNKPHIKMIVNYNDLDGFFIKFIAAYKNKFARKLGIQRSTDIAHLKTLIDMVLF